VSAIPGNRRRLQAKKEVFMNAIYRNAVVVVAAFLFSLNPNIVLAAPASQLALRWNELQPVLMGRQISVQLTDGATVEGRYSSLQADALSMEVSKTSDPAKHPKGAASLARPEVAQIAVMRHRGWKGRTIGLIAGGAIAATVVGVLNAIVNNESGAWSSTGAGIAAAVIGGVIGIGYLIGWLADNAGSRPELVVRIIPEDASR
jgi:hypothetical protein